MRWCRVVAEGAWVKLAIRRGAYDEALAMANDLTEAARACRRPRRFRRSRRQRSAACCRTSAGGRAAAASVRGSGSTRAARPAPGESSCGFAGLINEQTSRASAAYHDFAQSANVFDLLGERYQAALSHLSMGRLSAEAGSTARGRALSDLAETVFKSLGAQRDLDEAAAARERMSRGFARTGRPRPPTWTKRSFAGWWTRRSSGTPCARNGNRAAWKRLAPAGVAVFVAPPSGDLRVLAATGGDADEDAGHRACGQPGRARASRKSAAARVAWARSRRPALLRAGGRWASAVRRIAAGCACSPPWRARASSCAARANGRRR